MTKQDLQKELKEKIKPGVKASDLKKLKRSKSADDISSIPSAPPPPDHLLHDQLKEKQREVEFLRKESETKSTTIRLLRESLNRDDKEQTITELKQQLDQSLEARTNSLKDWQKQQEQIHTLNQELTETIDQASTELEKGDSEISQLRTKIWTLKSAKEQLERELKRERVRRNSALGENSYDNFLSRWDYLQFSVYTVLAVGFTLWLVNSQKPL